MVANDKEMMTRLESGGTWKIRLSSYDLADSTAAVNSIDSAQPATVTVAQGAGQSPTLTAYPALKQNVFQFQSGQTLQSSALEAAMTGEAYTIVALVDASSSGNIFAINNGTRGTQELSLKIQSGAVVLTHGTTTTNLATLTQPLDTTSGPLIIAASFGTSATDMLLQINGKLSAMAAVSTGTPADSSYILRQLMIGDSTGGSSVQTGELYVFTSRLTAAQANTVSRSIANKWNTAPIEYIPYPPEDLQPPPDSQNFVPVKQILYSRCQRCHGPSDDYFIVGLSETDLANSKWVTKGDSANSKLYTKLSGAGFGGDMPLNDPALSTDEIAAFKTWIDGLQ
jgi:hypothetical protein